jgi:hypothetical protein
MFARCIKFWFLLENASHYLPTDDIATMPLYESTLDYISLASSDSDEDHSSQLPPRGAMGCIIDLTGSDLEGGARSLGGGGGQWDGEGGLGGS